MMTQKGLLTVRYRLTGRNREFRREMAREAPSIAKSPGLVWKIWAFDAHRGTGLSAYLFETVASAEAFLAGPAIAGLRHHALLTDVACELAPVDYELSVCTGAGPAFAAVPDRLDRARFETGRPPEKQPAGAPRPAPIAPADAPHERRRLSDAEWGRLKFRSSAPY